MSRDATRLSAVRYDALRWNTVNLRSALPIEIQLSSASETRMIFDRKSAEADSFLFDGIFGFRCY